MKQPLTIFLLEGDGSAEVFFTTLSEAINYFKREADPIAEGDGDYLYEGTAVEWVVGEDKQDAIYHDLTFERKMV